MSQQTPALDTSPLGQLDFAPGCACTCGDVSPHHPAGDIECGSQATAIVTIHYVDACNTHPECNADGDHVAE